MSKLKIPAFRVSVLDQRGTVLHQEDFKKPPGGDLLDYRYGAQQWDNVRVRSKTNKGDMLVTFRDQTGGDTSGQHIPVGVNKDAEMRNRQGQLFRVRVEKLPQSQWATGEVLKFKPPRATIQQVNGGWQVTFEPQQKPCVLTVAVNANLTKDEELPSFPFPSNLAHTSGTFFIREGQFQTKQGGIIRLGVRGAGLSVEVKLPAAGKSVTIEPKTFKSSGVAQPELLTDQYVSAKYNEKRNQIQYR